MKHQNPDEDPSNAHIDILAQRLSGKALSMDTISDVGGGC
jgi:hypothetical protein